MTLIDWVLSRFRPKTVAGVVEDIFDKIDQLERISEQQELIYDQRQAQIDDLIRDQEAATREGRYAETVAARLRTLVV